MPADLTTPNYGWALPDVGGDATTWGATLNSDVLAIDAQVHANGGVPVGSIIMFAGGGVPTNWLLCNGASLATTGTYATLFAAIGYSFGGSGANFNVPNFAGMFPIGAYGFSAMGATGGEANHTLVVGEIPPHQHGVGDPGHTHIIADPGHGHVVADPGHIHGLHDPGHVHGGVDVPSGYPVATQPGSTVGWTSGNTAAASIGISISAASTGISLDVADTGIGIEGAYTGIAPLTSNVGGGVAHNNLPPYLAINFIIRFQ